MKAFFSLQGVFTTKNLAVMAMLAALHVILGQFSIYLAPNLRVLSIAYLPGVLVSILYGPWAGLAFGFVSDTLGYLVRPVGPYFIGYAVSEMAANLIYACFLYRRPVRIVRVLLARLAILPVVVFGLNFLWNSILYGTAAGKYFTLLRLMNNLVQLPAHVALIVFWGRLVRRFCPVGRNGALRREIP